MHVNNLLAGHKRIVIRVDNDPDSDSTGGVSGGFDKRRH